MNRRNAKLILTSRSHVSRWCCWLFVSTILLAGCALHPQPFELTGLSQRHDAVQRGRLNAVPQRYQPQSRARSNQSQNVVRSNQNRTVTGQTLAPEQADSRESTRPSDQQASTRLVEDHNVAQTSYQQPMERTYSSPSHNNVDRQYPGFQPHGFPTRPPNGFPQNPHPSQHPFGYHDPAPLRDPMLAPPLPTHDDRSMVNQHAHELPPPQVPAAMESMDPDMRYSAPVDSQARSREATPSQNMTENYATIRQPNALGSSPVLNHLTDGIRVSGSHLQERPSTATERALRLKSENESLRQELVALKARVGGLSGDVERRDKALQQAERLTQDANRANALLRDSVATFKVRLQDANKENQSIRQSADSTLEEIEATLDAVLVNTLSRNRKP